jgi:hypothetical protein
MQSTPESVKLKINAALNCKPSKEDARNRFFKTNANVKS